MPSNFFYWELSGDADTDVAYMYYEYPVALVNHLNNRFHIYSPNPERMLRGLLSEPFEVSDAGAAVICLIQPQRYLLYELNSTFNPEFWKGEQGHP